eukprot:3098545-Pleurochrysis_carterae.AAC.1
MRRTFAASAEPSTRQHSYARCSGVRPKASSARSAAPTLRRADSSHLHRQTRSIGAFGARRQRRQRLQRRRLRVCRSGEVVKDRKGDRWPVGCHVRGLNCSRSKGSRSQSVPICVKDAV